MQTETKINDITKERTIVLRQMLYKEDYIKYSQDELIAETDKRTDERIKAEARILTPTQQLQFVLKNDPDNEKYEIEKIFHSSFCRALSKAIPYTHFSNGTNYMLTKYHVDYTNTISQEVKRFEEYIKTELHLSIADFKLYYYCQSPFHSYWLRYSEDNAPAKPAKDTLYFSMSADGYSGLAQLIIFLVEGIYQSDYTQTNEFLYSLNPKVCYSNKEAYQYTYGNISIKRFANGRLDIKGMTENQVKLLNKLFAIHEQLRNK